METIVFISHQKRDTKEAIKIADYLGRFKVKVYLDEYDRDLGHALCRNNPKEVVKAIQKGIDNSTHMICIISPNTLTSEWVPFEIGYGYNKTDLAVLTLKGIENSDLPEYIKVAPVIRNTKDIDDFIKNKLLYNKHLFESTRTRYFSANNQIHPLVNVMDI